MITTIVMLLFAEGELQGVIVCKIEPDRCLVVEDEENKWVYMTQPLRSCKSSKGSLDH